MKLIFIIIILVPFEFSCMHRDKKEKRISTKATRKRSRVNISKKKVCVERGSSSIRHYQKSPLVPCMNHKQLSKWQGQNKVLGKKVDNMTIAFKGLINENKHLRQRYESLEQRLYFIVGLLMSFNILALLGY